MVRVFNHGAGKDNTNRNRQGNNSVGLKSLKNSLNQNCQQATVNQIINYRINDNANIDSLVHYTVKLSFSFLPRNSANFFSILLATAAVEKLLCFWKVKITA